MVLMSSFLVSADGSNMSCCTAFVMVKADWHCAIVTVQTAVILTLHLCAYALEREERD